MPFKPSEMHESDDELRRLLIDSVTDYAIFSLDPTGHVISWNPGAERLKGYSAGEIIGEHFSCFYTQKDQASGLPARALAEAIASGRFENEGWRVRKDGSRFWAWVVITPMYDSAGAHEGFAKITRDLSERKLAEDSRLRMAQLREAARVRNEFLAYISHEMRGPLASIQLQLDLIWEQQGKIAHESFDRIYARLGRSYMRLKEMVDSVLEQSRTLAGRAQIQPAQVELAKTITEIVEELRPDAEHNGLRLTSEVSGHTVFSTDEQALRVILQNLLRNAIKFSSRGTINVGLSAAGSEYHISVRDEGPGIPVADQERIFEPFERGESLTHKHTPGFGLGLATSRKLSEALGGRLELSSSTESGSTFILVLPSQNPSQCNNGKDGCGSRR